jgi:hypothetical protein
MSNASDCRNEAPTVILLALSISFFTLLTDFLSAFLSFCLAFAPFFDPPPVCMLSSNNASMRYWSLRYNDAVDEEGIGRVDARKRR